jgi:hypothetical protein
LHIFLIGVDDYKIVPLKVLFSNSLIPSLHEDLCTKINEKLSIDINAIERGMHDNINQDFEPDTPADTESSLDQDQLMDDMENASNVGEGGGQQEDDGETTREEGAEDEHQGEGDLSVVSKGNSGFKGKGHLAVYTLSKFWNFVDDSLDGIHKLAKTQVSEHGSLSYEHAFHKYVYRFLSICPHSC